jgi:catechol 2,3-dioxygenase-like lactoylglutathione lyase family enzyme
VEAFTIKTPVPVLRIFDEVKAREFYLDFLGFQIDWEHRYEANFPLYLQISSGTCLLHLSEHHGDGSPGTVIRIETDGLEEYQEYLATKNYKFAKPGIETTSYGLRELSVSDPFGNRLVFFERKVG